MTHEHSTVASRLRTALEDPESSVRLQAALAAGTSPDLSFVEVLLRRCAVEPDFFVRDMLSWALTRQERSSTVDRLLGELGSRRAQARSQALHTLSKTRDPRAWPAVTGDLLRDPDDEVGRTAWRTAVALVPLDDTSALAETLSTQLGRGDREVQLSLSRALLDLGAPAAAVVARATTSTNEAVRTHALATERLVQDPDAGFDAALAEARRVVALLGAPVAPDGTG
ncbi:HEAT repeat domain-containing protein [Aquipuribacter sp. MA13-6]|uniref:HEAT repeat domain-containing protein n=1 Tax=unclassified Aquipuribacter TaxID=2635084 RepID=UPI003EEBBF46